MELSRCACATADPMSHISPARGNGDVVTQQSGEIDSTLDMDDAFQHAAKGNFCAFQGQKNQLLQLVTSVHKDTILHIHLTAAGPKHNHSLSSCFVLLGTHWGREPPISCWTLVYRILANPIRYIYKILVGLPLYIRTRRASTISVGFVQNVLGECSDMLRTPNAKGETLLHLAARYGHDDIVQLLLSESRKTLSVELEAARPGSFLEMVNEAGDTALHEAVRYNHHQVVKALINEDPCYRYGPNKDGKTPLYLAAENENYSVAHEILNSCVSPACQGPDGRTALHAAVLNSCIDITSELVVELKSLIKEADESGMTPLHYAAQEGFLRIVAILLPEDKSAAYIGNNKDHNMTALHMAAKYRRANVMWQIMSLCPNSCEQVDNKGRNLLHFVVEGNSKRTLFAALSNPFVKLNLVNGKDNEGKRPLDKLPTSFNCLSYFDPYLTVYKDPSKINLVVEEWQDIQNYGARDDIDPNRRGQETRKGTRGEKEMESRDAYLVVATLIATVTFAAAFTMPGGYLTDKGTPVLIESTAFKVFVVADIASLMLSSFAVLIHFRLIMIFGSRNQVYAGLSAASFSTIFAWIMMVVAFSAAAYAVLSPTGSCLATLCYVLPIALAYCLVMYLELITTLSVVDTDYDRPLHNMYNK